MEKIIQYYTEKEMAELLGLALPSLRGRRYQGLNIPPFVRFGRSIYYPKNKYKTWMESLTKNPIPTANGRERTHWPPRAVGKQVLIFRG